MWRPTAGCSTTCCRGLASRPGRRRAAQRHRRARRVASRSGAHGPAHARHRRARDHPPPARRAARRPRSSRSPPAAWPTPRPKPVTPAWMASCGSRTGRPNCSPRSASGWVFATSTMSPVSAPARTGRTAGAPFALARAVSGLPASSRRSIAGRGDPGARQAPRTARRRGRDAIRKPRPPRFGPSPPTFATTPWSPRSNRYVARGPRPGNHTMTDESTTRQPAGRRRHAREPAAPRQHARRRGIRGAAGEQRPSGPASHRARPAGSRAARRQHARHGRLRGLPAAAAHGSVEEMCR